MHVSEEPNSELLDASMSLAPSGLPRVMPKTAVLLGKWQARNDWVTGAPLVLADICAATLSIEWLQILAARYEWSALSTHPAFSVAVVAFTLLVQHVHGLYPACGLPHSLEFRRVLRTSLMVVCGLALGALVRYPTHSFPLVGFLFFAGLLPLALVIARATVRSSLAGCDWWAQPVLVIGDGIEAYRQLALLAANRREGLRPVGIAYETNAHWGTSMDEVIHYVGPATELDAVLKHTRTCRVALTSRYAGQNVDFFTYYGIPHVTLSTDLGYHPTERTRVFERNGTIELHCYNAITSPGAQLAKRLLDIGLILLFAPVLAPLFLALMLAVKVSSPGPIFYGSRRLGQGGLIFNAWKFRSMVLNGSELLEAHFAKHPEDREVFNREHKLKRDPRITTVGRFLRRNSLDELPQLWNVLLGDMSLVGPRPILEEEPQKYGCVYDLYVMVRPGITGLWQISGRNNLAYEERLRLTRFYIQNWSCMLDLYILWRTVRTALLQEGAY